MKYYNQYKKKQSALTNIDRHLLTRALFGFLVTGSAKTFSFNTAETTQVHTQTDTCKNK